jgi:hypothetical protein
MFFVIGMVAAIPLIKHNVEINNLGWIEKCQSIVEKKQLLLLMIVNLN